MQTGKRIKPRLNSALLEKVSKQSSGVSAGKNGEEPILTLRYRIRIADSTKRKPIYFGKLGNRGATRLRWRKQLIRDDADDNQCHGNNCESFYGRARGVLTS